MRLLRGMAYGAISGILSAHSLLVAKSAVELLVRTIIDRVNQFNQWQSWMILLGLIVLALSQLYYLHRGLKLCSTSILYPFVFCIYNIIAILDGLIYFKQVSRLSVPHALLIALGTVILLAGVLALSWRLNNDPTTQPGVPSTPLAPGMGFVDETDSEDDDDDDTRSGYTSTTIDDEEALQDTPERHPLLSPLNGDTTSRVMTPTTKDNTILNVSKSRRQGMTEAAEIWGELEDAKPTYKESTRRTSTMSLPSRLRRETITNQEDGPNESTGLLRSGTSRSIGRGFGTTTSRRRSSLRRVSRRNSERRKDALGGWWKMKWWKNRKDRGDGDGDGD
ncbi:MAG: hypothetical protein M1812_005146 [Candelaria pacifica]|nr:MAG: hypothetical protein M1812_005146 [Candelaria pacifica]